MKTMNQFLRLFYTTLYFVLFLSSNFAEYNCVGAVDDASYSKNENIISMTTSSETETSIGTNNDNHINTHTGSFSCTLSFPEDSETCLSQIDDETNDHCAWCPIGDYVTLCVTEQQAAMIEQIIPTVSCDHYGPPNPPSPTPPKTLIPTIPDHDPDHILFQCLHNNFMKDCLSSTSGKSLHCVWCNTKGGYGICLTGSAAESAEQSDWYTDCINHTTTTLRTTYGDDADDVNDVESSLSSHASRVHATVVNTNHLSTNHDRNHIEENTRNDHHLRTETVVSKNKVDDDSSSRSPLDDSCMVAYRNDPTEIGCTSSHDIAGRSCMWCSIASLINVCFTIEQASATTPLGIVCDTSQASVMV
jgi:hypothetical protein